MPVLGRVRAVGTARPLPLRLVGGGADPLAPPFDVRAAVDEIGRDVMEGSSLREAHGAAHAPRSRRPLGPRRAASELARRRREVERRGNLAGTLDQVREELDQALSAEREFLAGRDGDDARLAEMSLDTLPDDTAGQVRELNDYQWRSAEGQQHWQNVLDLLRKEVLDAQFAGMKEALSGQNPAAMEAVREMMADLNALLAKHARGEDTSEDFDAVHGEARRVLPGEPPGRRRAHRRAGPASGRRRADDALAVPRAARGAGRPHAAGYAGHGPRDGDDPAGRLAPVAAARAVPRPAAGRHRRQRVARHGRRGRRRGRPRRPGGAGEPAVPGSRSGAGWTTSTWTRWSGSWPRRRCATSRRCASSNASWSGRATSGPTTTGCR